MTGSTIGTITGNTKRQADILLAYGFRPFFLLAAAHAVVTTLAWALMLAGRVPMLGEFPIGWHAFEMLYGFVGAGLAGFLLTAVPSFTNTRPVTGRVLLALVALWLAARAAMWLIGPLGAGVAAAFNLAFLGALIALIVRPLWAERQRRQRVFLYLLLALFTAQALTWAAWLGWLVLSPMRALNLSVAVVALMIIAAASRISMQIVNDALAARGEDRRYLARPPRRNLAMSMIALFALVEYATGASSMSGWLALAAAAAMLNLLNDWHLGRVLTDLYVAVLYSVYWLLALGFAAVGIDYLFGGFGNSHARHLVAAGAIGLSMIVVMVIAGQRHTGRFQLERSWVVCGMFAAVILATLLRVLAPLLWPAVTVPLGYFSSSLLWAAAFGAYLVRFAPWLTRPRIDGEPG